MTPQPWTCSKCEGRVQWRRTPDGGTTVRCTTHGVLASLPRMFLAVEETPPPASEFLRS